MATGAFRPDTRAGAGPLREKFAFDERTVIDDGAGNEIGTWTERFRTAAGLLALRGGEAVQAARLEGRQPYIATVRYSSKAAAVTTDWRCRDVRTGKAFAITTHVPRPRKDYIDMLIVEGIAGTEVTDG